MIIILKYKQYMYISEAAAKPREELLAVVLNEPAIFGKNEW